MKTFRRPSSARARILAAAMPAALLVLGTSGCGTEEPVDLGAQARVEASGRTALAEAMDPHTLHRTLGGTACGDCHGAHGGMMGTALIRFVSPSKAIGAGLPPPSFDPVAKTCSNVACHMVPGGKYQYWFMGGDGEPALNEVAYGGVPVTTPPWPNAMTGRCIACHHNPPSPPAGAWHSGMHGNTTSAAFNDCALCHPDATMSNGELALSTATNCGPNGTTASCAALHRNGTVDVRPKWRSACFGCH